MKWVSAMPRGVCVRTISPSVSLERVDAEHNTKSGSAQPFDTSSPHNFDAAVRPQDVSGLS